MESPETFKDMLLAKYQGKLNEIFGIVMLDNRHRLLEVKDLFFGTIDSAAVYPRIVVQECLFANAAACCIFHNHPSGIAEPSSADIEITTKLKKILTVVDVRLLDHFIIGNGYAVSLAERGEM